MLDGIGVALDLITLVLLGRVLRLLGDVAAFTETDDTPPSRPARRPPREESAVVAQEVADTVSRRSQA